MSRLDLGTLATLGVIAGLLGVCEQIVFGVIKGFDSSALASFAALTGTALSAKAMANAGAPPPPPSPPPRSPEEAPDANDA